MEDQKKNIFIVCPGLGHIRRGYESFAQELFAAYRNSFPDLEFHLFKGAGPNGPNEISLSCLKRESPITKQLGKVVKDAYWLECYSFSLLLVPHLHSKKPECVLTSDGAVANALSHVRNKVGPKFKIIFSNGGPEYPPYPHSDHIQQVLSSHYQRGLDAGVPKEKQSLIPYGFNPPAPVSTTEARTHLHERFGIGHERKVVLAVNSLSKEHKRMDFMLKALSKLDGPKPFLIALGQRGAETNALETEAEQLLGKDNFHFGTVPHRELPKYYAAADLFLLCSLKEGFGRVIIEAMMYGCPVCLHDTDDFREVAGDLGTFTDMTSANATADCIQSLLRHEGDKNAIQAFASKRYTWEALKDDYYKLLSSVTSDE